MARGRLGSSGSRPRSSKRLLLAGAEAADGPGWCMAAKVRRNQSRYIACGRCVDARETQQAKLVTGDGGVQPTQA